MVKNTTTQKEYTKEVIYSSATQSVSACNECVCVCNFVLVCACPLYTAEPVPGWPREEETRTHTHTYFVRLVVENRGRNEANSTHTHSTETFYDKTTTKPIISTIGAITSLLVYPPRAAITKQQLLLPLWKSRVCVDKEAPLTTTGYYWLLLTV